MKRRIFRSGDRLPVSPIQFSLHEPQHRTLAGEENKEDQFVSYLVDKDGNEYEPYSLAWRYLGLHIDCETDAEDRRELESHDEEKNCQRVLLWAAYHNPKYRGGSIGEYSFYNFTTNSYDASTCKTRRCTKLDCHELKSKFQLVGIFQETDGYKDFGEQLFKHEAYCLWDSDTYQSMQNTLGRFPEKCVQIYYFTDSDGNSLYLDLQPMPAGDIGLGLYIDDQCTELSGITFFDYVQYYYKYYYNDEERGAEAVEYWNSTIENFNRGMDIFKVCQPCRAYSLNLLSESSSSNEEGDKHRWLENDGEGDTEQYGYNCYDDAGYTNVNQCYKFETKTDLTQIFEESVSMASETIVTIRINGTVYGSGGFASDANPNVWFSAYHIVVLLTMGTFLLSMSFILYAYFELSRRRKRRRNILDASARQHFLQDTTSWEFRKGSLVDRLADFGEVVCKFCNDRDDDKFGDGDGSLTTTPTDGTMDYTSGSSLGDEEDKPKMTLQLVNDSNSADQPRKTKEVIASGPPTAVMVDWNDAVHHEDIDDGIVFNENDGTDSSVDVDDRWMRLRCKILDDTFSPCGYNIDNEDEDNDEGYLTAKESASSSHNTNNNDS